MGFFDNRNKKRCICIIDNLLMGGAIKNFDDRKFLLLNISLWIDDYINNNILIGYIFTTFYSDVKNSKITNKNDIININNILKKKVNISIFSNEETFTFIPEFRN
jgi:hypothetical protein